MPKDYDCSSSLIVFSHFLCVNFLIVELSIKYSNLLTYDHHTVFYGAYDSKDDNFVCAQK